ncbi:hypothetical protein D3C87_1716250 [compost metagenome]
MLAMTRIRPVGSSSADLRMVSAQVSASPRFMFAYARRMATRRRFSIRARRIMMGTAHNSPSCSGATN